MPIKTAPPMDYTKKFRPVYEHMEIKRMPLYMWYQKKDKNGIPTHQRLDLELQACTGKDIDEQQSEIKRKYRDAFDSELNIRRPPDPKMPFPLRGAFSYGYSWIAWRQAAIYAGAKEPPFCLSEMMTVAQSAMDYELTKLRNLRYDPEAFAEYLNESAELDYGGRLNTRSQSSKMIGAPDYDPKYRIVKVNPLVDAVKWMVYEACDRLLWWCSAVDVLNRLKRLGFKDSIRGAEQLMNRSQGTLEMRNCYNWLKEVFDDFERKHISNIKFCFYRGRGFDLLKIYDAKNHVKLKEPYYQPQKRSPLDSVVAQMSYTPDVHLQRGLEREFGHHMLEYEQLIMNKKIEPGQGLSRYMQRLLGEMSTVWDLKKMLERLFHRFDGEVRIQAYSVEALSVLWPEEQNRLQIGLAMDQIILRSPTTITKVLNGAERFTPELCKALWKEWDASSQDLFGKTLEEMFEINNIFTSPKPRWEPTKIEAPSFEHPITEESRTQSSHAYLKMNGLTLDPIKQGETTEKPNPPVEGPTTGPSGTSQVSEDSENHPIFRVSGKQMKLARKLFSHAGEEEGQSSVRWDDLFKLTKRIGFRVDEVGGSIVRFVPPHDAGLPFNEHRPHPEVSIGGNAFRAFGERLRQRYGWSLDWFERGGQDD